MKNLFSAVRDLRYSDSLLLFFIIVATITCYSKIGLLQFQRHWDDQWVVVNWFTEEGFSAQNLFAILTQYYHGQYSPVNQLYYTFLYQIGGYNPFVFHFAGLVLHLINVLLVYYFVKKIIFLFKLGDNKFECQVAFLSSLIFAIHPVLVESVAWLSASKILLYSFFYLLAILAYLNYLETRKKAFKILVYLFFIASFLAKEQALVLPLTLLLLDYFFYKQINKEILLTKIPFYLLSFLFIYVTFQSQASYDQGILTPHDSYPFFQRICFGAYALIKYFVQSLIPDNLSFLYPFPNRVGTKMPVYFFTYPIILIFSLIVLFRFSSNKWIIFGILFFVINLAVTLHVVPISRVAIVADRYTYISSIGIFFLIGYCTVRMFTKSKMWITACMFLYLTSLGLYTYNRVPVWRNSTSLKAELTVSK